MDKLRLWRAGQVLIALAVVASIYLVYARYWARGLGEKCDTSSDCRWSGLGHRVCLQIRGEYCTRPCVADRDCPPGWRCDPGNRQGPVCLMPPRRR